MADISVTLELNDSKYKKSIADATKSAKQFGKTISTEIDASSKSFAKLTSAIDNFKKAITNAQNSTKNFGKSLDSEVSTGIRAFDKLDTAINDYRAGISNAQNASSAFGNSIESEVSIGITAFGKLDAAINSFKNVIASAEASVSTLGNTINSEVNVGIAALDRLDSAVGGFQKSMNGAENSTNTFGDTVKNESTVAETSLSKLESTVNDLKGKFSNLENSFGRFGDSIKSETSTAAGSFGKLNSAVDGFQRNIAQAKNDAKGLGSSIKSGADTGISAFHSLGGIIAGIGFASILTDAARAAGDIVKTANALNIATGAAIAFQDAASAAGGEFDNARDGLINYFQQVAEAKNGNLDLLTSFNKLGITLKDLATQSNETLIKSVVEGLARVTDSTERARLANQLFGEDLKNVNYTEMAKGLKDISTNADGLAGTYKSVYSAQREATAAFRKFKDELLQAIPWDIITAGVKAFSALTGPIVAAATAFFALKGAMMVANTVMAAGSAVIASTFTQIATGTSVVGALGSTIGGVFGGLKGTIFSFFDLFKHQIGNMISGITNLIKVLSGVKTGLGAIQGLQLAFGSLLSVIGRATIITGVIYAVNELIKALSGFDVFDWVINKFKETWNVMADFGNKITGSDFFGKLSTSADKLTSSQDSLTSSAGELANKQLEMTKAFQDTQAAAQGLVDAYTLKNSQELASITNSTKMIGLSADQRREQEALTAAQTEYNAALKELQDKAATPGLDPSLVAEYESKINDLTTAYNSQKDAIIAAVSAQNEKIANQKMEAFATDNLIGLAQRLNDIETQRAKIGLTAIEQKYMDITIAAEKAAAAQIAAVASDQGISPSQVDPTTVNAINELARAGVEIEKARVAEYEKQNAFNEIRLGMEETLYQNNQKAVDLYKEMNAGVMSELQKKQFDITTEAQKQAEMLMREQELRTGILLTEEQRKEYIDKATDATKGLLVATEESYNQSREWSTGWQTAMQEYVDNAGNYANNAKEIFTTATKGMEDVLFNFVKTGKFTWDDFLQSMLDMLLKVAIEKAFAKTMGSVIDMIGGAAGALGSGGGGGGGGDAGGWATWIGAAVNVAGMFFADGGNIQAGSWGIVGEAGPELIKGPASIKPLKAAGMHASANLDVGQQAGTSVNYVTYNINATDAASFREMIAADPSFIYGVSMQGAKGIPSRR
jgi:lambda family phage tail tape measure protein